MFSHHDAIEPGIRTDVVKDPGESLIDWIGTPSIRLLRPDIKWNVKEFIDGLGITVQQIKFILEVPIKSGAVDCAG